MERASFRRLTLLLLLCVALTPGLWLRNDGLPPNRSGALTVTALPTRSGEPSSAPLTLAGAWHLTSPDRRFGGYSALIVNARGHLMAFSDFGTWLEIAPPDMLHDPDPRFGAVRTVRGKYYNDIEAAAYDPQSGMTWLALEFTNSVRRISAKMTKAREIAPRAMAGLPENGGVEAMARLADGRFVMLGEDGDWRHVARHPGWLFASDPVEGGEALPFYFEAPIGFSPVDAASLPDGRVLILLRGISLTGFPFFASQLVVADPAQIRPGQPWPWRKVADLAGIAPRENYEGLAIVPRKDGATLWLISDGNRSQLQRTLLLKLDWREAARP